MQQIHRRDFLKRSGLFAGLILVPRAGLYAAGESAATSTAAKERLVALADVDDNKMAGALDQVSDPPTDTDYRRMFDADAKELDMVLIATLDHHHAPAAPWMCFANQTDGNWEGVAVFDHPRNSGHSRQWFVSPNYPFVNIPRPGGVPAAGGTRVA
jgi:hypothetical protein